MNELKKDVYNIAKCITVFLVVLAHATRMYTGIGVVTPVIPSAFLKGLTEYIYSFHMPLFILLSGCVYGYCIEKGKYDKKIPFLYNKAKRLLLPYLFFGIAYVAPIMVWLGFTEQSYLSYLWQGIILSYNSRHLWYVFALFWIFVLAMVVRKWLLNGKTLFIVMALSVILYCMSSHVPQMLQLQAASKYQIFFFAGVCVNRYFERMFATIQKHLCLIIACFCGLIIMSRFYDLGGDLYLTYAFCGIVMILCVSTYMGKSGLAAGRIVQLANRDGYGIYFFHPMIIYILFAFAYKLRISPYIMCGGAFVISLILSCIMTILFRKIRLGSLLGE